MIFLLYILSTYAKYELLYAHILVSRYIYYKFVPRVMLSHEDRPISPGFLSYFCPQ